MVLIDMEWEENEFSGQQHGERILYVIRPHSTFFWVKLIRTSVLVVFISSILVMYGHLLVEPSGVVLNSIWLALLLGYLVYLWWLQYSYSNLRAFVTDRRIIRFTPKFLRAGTRRAVFWREVIKNEATPSLMLSPFFKVGRVEVVPSSSSDPGLYFDFVYYFDDLAMYFDKLTYFATSNPGELKTVMPFVARPYGERYPYFADLEDLPTIEDVVDVTEISLASLPEHELKKLD